MRSAFAVTVLTASTEGRAGSTCVAGLPAKDGPGTAAGLRLTRRGDVLEFATRSDADLVWWTFSRAVGVNFAADLNEGVIAGHTGTAGFTATFEDFAVESLAPDPKK